MSKSIQPASGEAKLLSPNYFKQRMLVPPSGFQVDSRRSANIRVSPQRQRESSMHRNSTEIVNTSESVQASNRLLQDEVCTLSTSTNSLQAPLRQNGPVPTSFQSGTKRLHSRLQVQTVPKQSMDVNVQTSVTREDSPSTAFVAKKLKTAAATTVQKTDQHTQRVVADWTDGDTTERALITAEEDSGLKNNIESHTVKSNTQLVLTDSPKVKQKSDDNVNKTSGEVATTVSLQYDNYFKYAAGRCAIATTKQGWEFADTEEETEVGEVLFHRSLANKLARADKHLKKYFNTADSDGDASTGQQLNKTQPVARPAHSICSSSTTPTEQSANYSSSSVFTSELVPTETYVARHSKQIEADASQTTDASLEIIEFEAKRSLSSGDWSLNDLSVPDDTTPPSNGSCVELFTSQSEEIPNTYEIQQLARQAATQPKIKEVGLHHSHQSSAGIVPPALEAAKEQRGVKMATSSLRVDTQNDTVIAKVLQSEEESRSACGYGQYHEFSTDHEMAEQLQLELDREMAKQIHHEEQQQQQHHGYRAHDSYHHSSHNPYYSAARSDDRAHFDNNGPSHYVKQSDRRRYEQGHPCRSHTHSDRGHQMMYPLQEHTHDHSHGGEHHRMVGSVEAAHPLYYPGHHRHFGELQDEMDLTYEALSELEDVSRGLDRKTVSRLTTLYEYVPPQTSSSAELTTSRSCSICLSDFEKGQMVRSLPCFHLFHRHCIDRWLESNKQCPVCQIELQPNNS